MIVNFRTLLTKSPHNAAKSKSGPAFSDRILLRLALILLGSCSKSAWNLAGARSSCMKTGRRLKSGATPEDLERRSNLLRAAIIKYHNH